MISIPLPFTPVPINLATLSVFLAGGLLGSKGSAISQIVYVFIGAVGLPVFANFQGGPGVLAGPTGGYVIGYIVAALLIGFILERIGRGFYKNIVAMVVGLFACYGLGTLWFMHVTGMGLLASLLMCVVPFLIGDFLKIVVAAFLTQRLYQFI
jgi:biotin transport system substrate-specific component